MGELLQELADYLNPDATECYETLADRFYAETGLMAPGKSVPMEMWTQSMDAERQKAWPTWVQEYRRRLHERVLDELAALEVSDGE